MTRRLGAAGSADPRGQLLPWAPAAKEDRAWSASTWPSVSSRQSVAAVLRPGGSTGTWRGVRCTGRVCKGNSGTSTTACVASPPSKRPRNASSSPTRTSTSAGAASADGSSSRGCGIARSAAKPSVPGTGRQGMAGRSSRVLAIPFASARRGVPPPERLVTKASETWRSRPARPTAPPRSPALAVAGVPCVCSCAALRAGGRGSALEVVSADGAPVRWPASAPPEPIGDDRRCHVDDRRR
jgi:hypothetical protein